MQEVGGAVERIDDPLEAGGRARQAGRSPRPGSSDRGTRRGCAATIAASLSRSARDTKSFFAFSSATRSLAPKRPPGCRHRHGRRRRRPRAVPRTSRVYAGLGRASRAAPDRTGGGGRRMTLPPTVVNAAAPRARQSAKGVLRPLLWNRAARPTTRAVEIEKRHVGRASRARACRPGGREGRAGAHDRARPARDNEQMSRLHQPIEAKRDRGLEADDPERRPVNGWHFSSA